MPTSSDDFGARRGRRSRGGFAPDGCPGWRNERFAATVIPPMDPLATIVERLCAWKDVNRETRDGKDCFLVRGQVFAYLGKKGVVVKLAPPQVTEALKIIGAKRMPDDGDPHSREFVEIPVTGPREVERAMMWLRRACRLGRTAAGPV